MKLSIIIPCFNKKDLLSQLISLVKDAPVDDKEIILVDDGSNDGTTDLIRKELAQKVDQGHLSSQEYGERGGKKIGWKDGFKAIFCIIRYGLFA